MRQTSPTPLFPWDAGWLYLLAGLVIVAAATIVPAQRDLAEVDQQLRELQAKEQYCCDRLAAYSGFLDQWQRLPDDMLVRLASAQLNQRPKGDRPVVLASNVSSAVTDWIDSRVAYEPPAVVEKPQSMLSRLSDGRGQLWMLAAGALAVFVGLVLGPTATGNDMLAEDAADEQDVAADDDFLVQPDNAVMARDTAELTEDSQSEFNPVLHTKTAGRFATDDLSLKDDVISDMDTPMLFDVAPVNVDVLERAAMAETDLDEWEDAEADDDGDTAVAVSDDEDAQDEDAESVGLRDNDEDEEPDEDEQWDDDEDGEEWEDDDDEEWDDEEYEDEDDDEYEDEDPVDDEEAEADEDEQWEEDEEDDEDDEEWEDDEEDDDDLFVDDEEDDDEDEWDDEEEEDEEDDD